MSVVVCRGPAAVPPAFEAPCWLRPVEPPYKQPEVVVDDDRPAQVDIWNAIQADVDNKVATGGAKKSSTKPYVHPLVRRSSSRLMSQKSLEICTESLGNETGSGDFTSSLDDVMASLFDSPAAAAAAPEESFWQQQYEYDAAKRCCDEEEQWETTALAAVNYHCSAGTGTRSPRRAFPPPLPSMSRRDGPCLQMRARRHDGRLVVEAVAVRPRGYLHAKRQAGRLRLSFVECSARDVQSAASKITVAAAAAEAPYFRTVKPRNNVQEDEEEEAVGMVEDGDVMEEEEVEVVDRGSVVEVKVSTQPQTHTAAKVHRSTLVINKFVGSTPVSGAVDQPRCCGGDADDTATQHNEVDTCDETAAAAAQSPRPTPSPILRRVPSSTTTLAAAVAVASTGGTDDDVPAAPEEEDDDECGWLHLSGGASPAAAETNKQQLLLSFTSRRGDRQDLLQSVRRCRQLRQKKLFILEPYCIATS